MIERLPLSPLHTPLQSKPSSRLLTEIKSRKEDIPPECFSKKPSKRNAARLGFKKEKVQVLREQGRKLKFQGTFWRDDGVGYSWEKVGGGGAGSVHQRAFPSGVADSEWVNGGPHQPSLALASSQQTAGRSQLSPIFDGHADRDDEPPSYDEKIFHVPWPPHLTTPEARLSRKDDVIEWRTEQLWGLAAEPDDRGRSTRKVTFKSSRNGPLIITSKPLLPGELGDTLDERKKRVINTPAAIKSRASTSAVSPSKEMLPYKTVIPYPPQFDSKRLRHKAAFLPWVEAQDKVASMIDANGRPTRFVVLKKNPSGLTIRWRPIDEGGGTVKSAQGLSRAESPQQPPMKRARTDKGQAKAPATIHPTSTSKASNGVITPTHTAVFPLPPHSAHASASTSFPTTSGFNPPTHTPTVTSEALRTMQTAMQTKLTAIDNWTNILADYPERAEAIGKQVERTQGEIFDLLLGIEVEKRRLRGIKTV